MDRTELQLPCELTVSHVTELRDTLLAALESGKPIELDPSQVVVVDVPGLQLLCALHRHAVRLGIPVTFRGGNRGRIIEEGREMAGFARKRGCERGCLWEEVACG